MSKVLDRMLLEIKPELEEMEGFEGKKIIDNLLFDSIDLVQLMVSIEEYLNINIFDMEEFIDVIQEYDTLSSWIENHVKE